MNIFDFAQTVEKSGQLFYREMAKACRQQGLENVFNMLAEDQARLLKKLADLKFRYADVEMEDCKSLKSKDNVFESLRKNRKDIVVTNDIEAYELALDAERRIYAQYERAIALENDAATRNLLRRIAASDRGELRDIEQVYDFVNAPNEFLEWGEFSNLDEFHNFGRYVD